MLLKKTIDQILKEKSRSLTWLAFEMDKTFDGFKLSLTRGSIKYNDILRMARILEVNPSVFFETGGPIPHGENEQIQPVEKSDYIVLKANLTACGEMLVVLKNQMKDKDKIISLLSRG
ncbi:hypothetical protein [Pedobacter metabolipauper]|uniref:Cro/C1-type helix-turn-helix DNA-binding protein n=1 Tax=Pedobacter metabolipauper TaxID=425513 RepID=A0A4R6SYG1_9SPHI|nr:hypothetical protein [Pedobacter metabolipauper]TDQ09535.1 hypothetical protein ATK78_1691 [Pedobacter metabolipauper]